MNKIFVFSLFAFGLTSVTWAAPVCNAKQPCLVSQGIYRGGRLNPISKDAKSLAKMHFKTIINLQGGDPWFASVTEPGERPELIREEKMVSLLYGITALNFPLNSTDEITPSEKVSIRQVLQIMADPNRQPVYVHCEHGVDRTGLVVALYRVLYEGQTPLQAHLEMEDMGHNWLHKIFTGAMDQYFFKATEGH
jgi:protein tyrosine/serine phosphatase